MGYQILHIDDSKIDQLILKRFFEKASPQLQIQSFSSTDDAALFLSEKTADELPDLVVTDLETIGKGGHWMINHIRSLSEVKKIPVVILSASDFPNDKNKAKQTGAKKYITKPVDFKKVQQMLNIIGS